MKLLLIFFQKKFPSFKLQIHNLCTTELQISNIKEETFEERTKLSYEELLELYKKEHEENLKLKETKFNIYENFERNFNELYNKDENFTNEIKRFIYETIPEYVINYTENSKINTSKLYQDKFRCTSSIDLGNIGENYVKDLLNELEIKYEDHSGVKYHSDIHIKDEVNHIIYILEVKNRSSIPRTEIEKFKRDIENITNLNPDYTIVPLFISLNNSNINETKGKFNITDNVTYITLPYVTKETLQMFFELNRNVIQYLHSNEELNKSIKTNQNLINMFLSLTKSSNNIDLLLNNLKKENLSIQQIIFNNLPSNLTIKELQKLKIKIQLILYIKITPKWTLKECKLIDSKGYFIKHNTKRDEVKTILGM